MEKKVDSSGPEKPDEFGVFSEEYCRVNDFLAAEIGFPVWARVKVCWRMKDLKPGVSALPPMQVFAILFGDFVSKLIESGAKGEDLRKLYDLSMREKIDLFLSENVLSALSNSGFSAKFTGITCEILDSEGASSGEVLVVAEETRVTAVETAKFGTSWLPASRADDALVSGGESGACGLIDTLHQDNGSKGAAVLDEGDMALAPTCVMALDDLEDVLKKPGK